MGVWSLSFGTESGVSLGEEVVIVCLSSFFSLCSDFSPSPFKGEVSLSSLVKIGASSSSLSSSPLSLSLLVLVLLVLVYVSSEERESKVVRERGKEGRGREGGSDLPSET